MNECCLWNWKINRNSFFQKQKDLISYPSYKAMSDVLWKLLILFQLFKEDAVPNTDSHTKKDKQQVSCSRRWWIKISKCFHLNLNWVRLYWLVMKLIEILHVPKDDVLLVDNSWRNFLHTAGHFPQVCLHNTLEEIKPFLKPVLERVCVFFEHVKIAYIQTFP